MSTAVSSYYSNTKNLLYVYLFSLPLFLAYEILILLAQPSADQIVRISVDVWFKTIFTYLGVNAVSISLLIVALGGFYILYKERAGLKNLNFKYFPILLIESFLLAIIVAFISQFFVGFMLNLDASSSIESLTGLQKFALSLGAGLYEELFFRVVLVSLFILVFTKLFNNKRALGIFAAVTLSAALFSAVHYIGSMGDPFTISSFLFRFVFGLLLNGVYVWRGFGVAAWTHALYDLIVLFLL